MTNHHAFVFTSPLNTQEPNPRVSSNGPPILSRSDLSIHGRISAVERVLTVMETRLGDIEKCLLSLSRHFGVDEDNSPQFHPMSSETDIYDFINHLKEPTFRNHVVRVYSLLYLIFLYKQLFVFRSEHCPELVVEVWMKLSAEC